MSDNDQYGIIIIDESSVKPKITCSKCKKSIDRIDNYCRYCGVKFLGTRIILANVQRYESAIQNNE